jgi:predicted alpha/beta-fold hydrolase
MKSDHLSPETLDIECTGYSVVADLYAGQAKTILLSLVGWTSSRRQYSDIVSAIVKNTGMPALVFDYSGHGDSPFDVWQTRPAQHFLEVICAFDWIRDTYPDYKIAVMGTSYGGFLATQLTKYRAFDQLVLRVPAIYQPSDFYTRQRDIDREWTDTVFRHDAQALAKHPLLSRASNFKGRTLVIVHEKDAEVPVQTTDAYIKAFGADVYLAKGFPHSVGKLPRDQIIDYQNTISDWLNQTRS